jgi:endo-1,4-beta-xylanase
LKWETIHPAPNTYDFTEADSIVAFAQQHGMKARDIPWCGCFSCQGG